MSELKELTKIERELVLQYLRDDNVPLTVTLEDKPEQIEGELNSDKTDFISEEEKISPSAVFPVAIPTAQMEVLDQGIILLKKSVRSFNEFLNKKIKVQFYFNHLGLFFTSVMKEYSKGLAIVIPSSIYRIPDLIQKKNFDFIAELSFNSNNDNKIKYDCFPRDNYRFFTNPRWNEIEIEKQVLAKSLLEEYVSEIKKSEEKTFDNGLHLISVVRFLTETNYNYNLQAVEGRVEPLEIIYTDNTKIVLSSFKKDKLSNGCNYDLCFSFSIPENKNFKRIIELKASVVNVYSYEERETYVLRFDEVKEEDNRFLYERINGKKIFE